MAALQCSRTHRTLITSRRAVLQGAVGGAMLGFAPMARADAFLDEAAIGSPDAPVTILEYASMTCSHCAEFHRSAMPALKAEYLDTGKARLIVSVV